MCLNEGGQKSKLHGSTKQMALQESEVRDKSRETGWQHEGEDGRGNSVNLFSGPGKATGKGGKYCRERREPTDKGWREAARGRTRGMENHEDDIPLPERGACGKGSGHESGCQEKWQGAGGLREGAAQEEV